MDRRDLASTSLTEASFDVKGLEKTNPEALYVVNDQWSMLTICKRSR